MKISFSPIRSDKNLDVERQGDVLIVNGDRFDFAPLTDGLELPRTAIKSAWFCGPVRRVDGAIHLHLLLPHGQDAPAETLFPDPITLADDGPVTLPLYQRPMEEHSHAQD